MFSQRTAVHSQVNSELGSKATDFAVTSDLLTQCRNTSHFKFVHVPKSMCLSPMNAHPLSLHAAALEAHRRLALSRCRLWSESTVLLEDKPARGGCSLLHSSTLVLSLVHTSSSPDVVHCFPPLPMARERGQGMLPHSSAENQLKGIKCNAP